MDILQGLQQGSRRAKRIHPAQNALFTKRLEPADPTIGPGQQPIKAGLSLKEAQPDLSCCCSVPRADPQRDGHHLDPNQPHVSYIWAELALAIKHVLLHRELLEFSEPA
jgi:hypothetical protein